jgi:hypothetical protein
MNVLQFINKYSIVANSCKYVNAKFKGAPMQRKKNYFKNEITELPDLTGEISSQATTATYILVHAKIIEDN